MKLNKKAFTLVEIVVVVIIISLLASFAFPKLLQYIERAGKVHILNDTQALRDILSADIRKYEDMDVRKIDIRKDIILEEDPYIIEVTDLEAGRVYSNTGKVDSPLIGTFYRVKSDYLASYMETDLGGIFITDLDGKAYYIDKSEN